MGDQENAESNRWQELSSNGRVEAWVVDVNRKLWGDYHRGAQEDLEAKKEGILGLPQPMDGRGGSDVTLIEDDISDVTSIEDAPMEEDDKLLPLPSDTGDDSDDETDDEEATDGDCHGPAEEENTRDQYATADWKEIA